MNKAVVAFVLLSGCLATQGERTHVSQEVLKKCVGTWVLESARGQDRIKIGISPDGFVEPTFRGQGAAPPSTLDFYRPLGLNVETCALHGEFVDEWIDAQLWSFDDFQTAEHVLVTGKITVLADGAEVTIVGGRLFTWK